MEPLFADQHGKNAMETLGTLGENLATSFLKAKGWNIIERNYRTPFGEIDIIVREPGGVLVLVEVKTLKGRFAGLTPEDNLTGSKLRKMRRIGEFYANKNPQLVNSLSGWRLDLLAIEIVEGKEEGALTKWEKDYTIKHYENL